MQLYPVRPRSYVAEIWGFGFLLECNKTWLPWKREWSIAMIRSPYPEVRFFLSGHKATSVRRAMKSIVKLLETIIRVRALLNKLPREAS